MLSTLIGQIQGYFSKYFLVGSFSPMLAFTFINGAIAYLVLDSWQAWADKNLINATGGAFFATSVAVGVLMLSYVLSSLGTFLRQLLEGKWYGFLAGMFIPAQNRRRLKMLAAVEEAFREMTDLGYVRQWDDKLREARAAGSRAHPRRPFALPAGSAAARDPIEAALAELERMRQAHEIIKAQDLTDLAGSLQQRLGEYDVDVSEALEQEHQRLSALIEYATGFFAEGARGLHTQLQNEMNSNFGAQAVAPTKMGNIANTIQSYVMRRYSCNLEVLWSNLMQVVQKDDKAQATVMEAKTQLDFLVACAWLTLLTGLIWSVMTFAIVPNRLGFLAAALGGPLGAYLWYRAAAEQYRSFADIVMTAFDVFRFDLLRMMRLPVPTDVEHERLMWASVDKLMTFGEMHNFRYDRPAAPAPSQTPP